MHVPPTKFRVNGQTGLINKQTSKDTRKPYSSQRKRRGQGQRD